MSKITNCLLKKDITCKPIWFMRQAGRYLPEFRKIRKNNKNFIKLCLNSRLSSELTLQPIKRYNLDAAIIFSDILIIPYALGQDVSFSKYYGPKLGRFNFESFTAKDNKEFLLNLRPVYDAIKITRKKLKQDKSLISFVGAPWTLMVYMLGLKTTHNKLDIKKFNSYSNKFEEIIKTLSKYICLHINEQHKSGSDIIQVFDSWAGLVPKKHIKNLCYQPNKEIVNFCKKKRIPVICFPKGLSDKYKNFVQSVKPNGINIDYDIKPKWARDNLRNVCIQGGLHPKYLLGNEKVLKKKVNEYLKVFSNVPYIFNLGHGMLPETKPSVVNKIVKRVGEFKNDK